MGRPDLLDAVMRVIWDPRRKPASVGRSQEAIWAWNSLKYKNGPGYRCHVDYCDAVRRDLALTTFRLPTLGEDDWKGVQDDPVEYEQEERARLASLTKLQHSLDIEAQKRKLRRIGENILLERLERSKAQ